MKRQSSIKAMGSELVLFCPRCSQLHPWPPGQAPHLCMICGEFVTIVDLERPLPAIRRAFDLGVSYGRLSLDPPDTGEWASYWVKAAKRKAAKVRKEKAAARW